jgi:hypothetical protein
MVRSFMNETRPTPPTPPNKPTTPMPQLKPEPSLQRKNKKLPIILGAGAIIALSTGALFAFIRQSQPTPPPPTPTPIPSPTPTPTPALSASNLDGMMVPTALATRHPLAIMVENHPDARPQAGLSEASVVYEAITEGGITRFMVVFGHTLPPKVGPVRSARMVFVNFAEEFTPVSAYYAHAGGAANALDYIRNNKFYDVDFSSGGGAFQRFPKAGVASEHTLFSFPEKLYSLATSKGYKAESDFKSWKFKEDADSVSRPDAQTITIPFSSASYSVKYVYDKTTNSYKRFLGGSEHKDANNSKQYSPKNVVVEFASYETIIAGKKEVQKVGTIGSGTAKIFRDGKAIDAKWSKPTAGGRTIYTDAASGAEIEFNRGQTWVEVPKIGTNIAVQ